MTNPSDNELAEALQGGSDKAFERFYDRYQQQTRLMAWGLARRADWIDDLTNETWCRAFRLRRTYNPDRPFLLWLAGILKNVFREHCRNSPVTRDADDQGRPPAETDDRNPDSLVSEAELLVSLNECVANLAVGDQTIVRLRFFEEKSLRAVAQEVMIPESTLRDVRLPAILKVLRTSLARKGINLSEFFPAQDRPETQ